MTVTNIAPPTMSTADSIPTSALPALTVPPPEDDHVSRALTAILRHEFPGQAFTLEGLQRRLHMTVSDGHLLRVLQTRHRRGQPRFTVTPHEGQDYWRLTDPDRSQRR